jgi:drug/metabolite transporter (DMT)-like permease
MKAIRSDHRLALAAAFATVYVVWGSTYLAIRVAVESMPPFLMASGRFLIAGAMLLAWARVRGAPSPSFAEWRDAAIAGTLMLAGGNGLVSWAETSVSSGLAAVIVATVPAWFALFDWIRPGGTRPTTITLVGIAVGFCGVAMLLAGGAGAGANLHFTVTGLLAMVTSTVLWAAGSIWAKNGSRPISPVLGAALQMLCGGGSLLLIALVRGETMALDLAEIPRRSWAAWGYLVVMGSFVAFNAFNYMLRHASPAAVSTYAFVNPVVAVFLGWLLLDESISGRMALAMLVIVLGVVLITLGPWALRRWIAARDRV